MTDKNLFQADLLPVVGTSVLIEVELSDTDSEKPTSPQKHSVRCVGQTEHQYVIRRRVTRKPPASRFLKRLRVSETEEVPTKESKLQENDDEKPLENVFTLRQLKGMKMERQTKRAKPRRTKAQISYALPNIKN